MNNTNMLLQRRNGHTAESTTTSSSASCKLDDPRPTSTLLSKEKEVKEEIKPNGIFKHDQQHGDEVGEVYDGDEGEGEEEEEEEEVVFVVGGTDVSTWTTERERRGAGGKGRRLKVLRCFFI